VYELLLNPRCFVKRGFVDLNIGCRIVEVVLFEMSEIVELLIYLQICESTSVD